MKTIFALFVAFAFMGIAAAQSPVITQPYGVTTQNSSSSITATNTFQTIWTKATTTRGRAGCFIQNLGTNTMWVFFGAAASGLTPSSIKITAGQTTTCNLGGIVMQDTVSIAGTTGDQFLAIQQ